MKKDKIFAYLFTRLFPLIDDGPVSVTVMADHKSMETGKLWHGNVGPIADALARNIALFKERHKSLVLRVDTPDHVSHFVRVF